MDRKIVHIITRLEKGGSSKNTLISLNISEFDNYIIYGNVFAENDKNEEGVSFDKEKTFKVESLIREISPLRDISAFFRIYEIIKTIRPDIVHTHTSKAGVLGRLAAFLYNIMGGNAVIIHTPHGHLLYGYYGKIKTAFFKFIEIVLSSFSDYLVALSEGERKESVAAFIGDEKKWRIIHSGINFPKELPEKKSARKRKGLKEDDFIFGTVARLEKVKGVDIFLKAFIRLIETDKNAICLIVGDGAMRKDLEKMVFENKAQERVVFAGFAENVYDWLVCMDVYVQPSLNEAMGRTVLEAQYCGLPAIVSSACGLPYMVDNTVTGLVFKKSDSEDLLEKMLYLRKNEQEISRLGNAARSILLGSDEQQMKPFSAESMNKKLFSLYTEALSPVKK